MILPPQDTWSILETFLVVIAWRVADLLGYRTVPPANTSLPPMSVVARVRDPTWEAKGTP